MPVAAYRELMRTPSVPWLFVTSIVGRFHQGMTGLALMMLTTEHASYTVYSAVSAAGVAGAVVAGPLLSRLADTHGRRRVLTATTALHTAAMAALILAPPRPAALVGLSLLLGLCTPPMTSAVRAALPTLLRSGQRRTYFALEATSQEVIFVAGPVITSSLAAFGGPRLALGACGALVLVGTLAYVRDRNAEAGRTTAAAAKGGSLLRRPGLPRLYATGFLLTGALAGQVLGVVATVSGRQVSSEAGFVIAVGSLGSLVGGLVHGTRGHRARLRHLMLLLTAGLAVLPLATGEATLTVLLFFWGLTVAPAMSGLFERLSATVPDGSAAEAFGWMNSMFAAGNVAGTALGGLLITQWGARAPLVAACGLGLLAALVCEPWTRPGRGAADPDDAAHPHTRPATPSSTERHDRT
ncbi:MFS transporter [Streptomyces sp. NPDC004539]|uniref:MFS transporter n=1 Tax=Streptomyces sp. NPDC004539 TaxID=3154280 RepID=UPI0033A05392